MSLLQKRLIEVEKRKKLKELREKEKEERRRRLAEMEEDGEMVEGKEEEEEEKEEEEEPLPEIFTPSTPSRILCGFYSGPGKFWVSLVSNNIISGCSVIPSPTYLIVIIFSTFLLFHSYGKTSFINYY